MQPEQNNKVVIIFTQNDNYTTEIFSKFPKPDYFKDENAFLDANYPITIINDDITPINPVNGNGDITNIPNSIILVKDDELNADTKAIIKFIVDKSDEIYIVYHKGSEHLSDQSEFFYDITNNKKKYEISQHHTGGSVFEILKSLALNLEGFIILFNKLLKLFPNPVLEAKLIINKLLYTNFKDNKRNNRDLIIHIETEIKKHIKDPDSISEWKEYKCTNLSDINKSVNDLNIIDEISYKLFPTKR